MGMEAAAFCWAWFTRRGRGGVHAKDRRAQPGPETEGLFRARSRARWVLAGLHDVQYLRLPRVRVFGVLVFVPDG